VLFFGLRGICIGFAVFCAPGLFFKKTFIALIYLIKYISYFNSPQLCGNEPYR
jgi:hypothetical protein